MSFTVTGVSRFWKIVTVLLFKALESRVHSYKVVGKSSSDNRFCYRSIPVPSTISGLLRISEDVTASLCRCLE